MKFRRYVARHFFLGKALVVISLLTTFAGSWVKLQPRINFVTLCRGLGRRPLSYIKRHAQQTPQIPDYMFEPGDLSDHVERAAASAEVNIEYSIELKSGQVVDSGSMEFTCGEGLIFAGLDKGVQGMAKGETRKLDIAPEDGYGIWEDFRTLEVPLDQFTEKVEIGQQIRTSGLRGEDMTATVIGLRNTSVILDGNHPLAGHPLLVTVTLKSFKDAPAMQPMTVETESEGDQKTYPKVGDFVTVHYAGMLADGAISFNSTRDHDKPFRFQIGFGKVIKALDDGIPLMSLGERALFRVPSSMAYGEVGVDGVVPPGADLLYDVELLKIEATTLID